MSGGGKGGSDTQEVTQTNEPWPQQAPYLQGLYQQAANLPQQEPYPFPGFVPFSPATQQAQQMQQERALAGSPLTGAAQQEAQKTLQGGYLDIANTPAFKSAFEAAKNQIMPSVQSQFEMAGQYGGGLSQEAQARALSDAFASQWSPLYTAERNRQQNAVSMAPGLAQQDYFDIGQLGNVGAQQEAKAGQALQDAMQRWAFQQQAPYQQLSQASNIIQGGYPGGTSEMQTPIYSGSLGQNLLGGASTGLGAMSGLAGLTGGAVPAFSPLVGALGPLGGAAATWGGLGALLGGLAF